MSCEYKPFFLFTLPQISFDHNIYWQLLYIIIFVDQESKKKMNYFINLSLIYIFHKLKQIAPMKKIKSNILPVEKITKE